MRAYDPFDAEVIADPYPWYRRLRDEGVHHQEAHDVWVISRYADVRAAARDHDRFSSADGVAYTRFPLPMLLSLDPPDHTRLRRLVARSFTPREIDARRGTIERLASQVVDEAVETAAVDWVEVVAGPLPLLVIAELIGIPDGDIDRFRTWSDTIIEGFGRLDTPEASAAAGAVAGALVELRAYFDALDTDAPPGSLLDLLRRDAGEERLTPDELFWFFLLLLVAGNETTTNLLGNLVAALVGEPSQWRYLTRHPGQAAAAIEEALRFDAPIQGFYRTAREPVTINGATIPVGGRVLLLYGSANRDGSHYPEPDEFRAERNPVDHLAFGNGIHHCLGAALARLEGTAVLTSLLPRVAAVEGDGEAVRTQNPTIRGFRRLPVRLTPR